jgi:hypothetical protein
MAKKGDGKKGTFSFLRLPIAKQYVWPESRAKMILIGAIGCLIFIGYFAFDYFFHRSNFVSNGPLSSYHASFESDCKACHTPLKTVTSEKCSVCHEMYGSKVGVYTYPAHYIYRSGDPKRLSLTTHGQVACYSCHTEHVGRDNHITEVSDSKCLACHNFGSFNKNHPEFEFAAKHIPDDQNLTFPHVSHIKEIMQREKLVDIEKACLYCHQPQPDGKSFQPIAFDRSCDACHLTAIEKTPPLAARDPNNPLVPGVATLDQIQAGRQAGTTWTAFTSPSDFQNRGGGIVKSPIYHADPWIMENLKLIRKTLYPDLGISALLNASGKSEEDARVQYQEAIDTLKDYEVELRSRPQREVQTDLQKIDATLKLVQRKMEDPTVYLDPAVFQKSPAVNPKLTAAQVKAFKDFALELTQPCQKCHLVKDAAIQTVQKDQRILHRAEFDHRAHILQRRCLDCHNTIPIADMIKGTKAHYDTRDTAEVQNIPTIENCRQCHNSQSVSNRCVTCHEFHPNKTHRSSMLLYLD